MIINENVLDVARLLTMPKMHTVWHTTVWSAVTGGSWGGGVEGQEGEWEGDTQGNKIKHLPVRHDRPGSSLHELTRS